MSAMQNASGFSRFELRRAFEQQQRRRVRLTVGLAFLMAPGFLIAAAVYRNWKAERTTQALLIQSNELEQQGQFPEAIATLEAYLDPRPLDEVQTLRFADLASRHAVTHADREQAIAATYRAKGLIKAA